MLIGIDWGGTKIEGVAMEADGRELLRLREVTPRHDYQGCIRTIKTMIEEEEQRRRAGDGLPDALLQLPLFARRKA